jgi:hypothetical protein
VLVRSWLRSFISSDEFSLDSHLFPVLGTADTDILEFFDQLIFPNFFFFMVMTQYFEEELPVFFFVAQHWISIVLLSHELILIKLFLFDIVEHHDMFVLEMLEDDLGDVGIGDVFDVGRTSREVVENVADLEVVEVQVSLV